MASFLNAYTCTSPRAGSAGRSPAPRLHIHRHVQLAAFVTLFTIAILEPQTHRVNPASCVITVQSWRAERCPQHPCGVPASAGMTMSGAGMTVIQRSPCAGMTVLCLSRVSHEALYRARRAGSCLALGAFRGCHFGPFCAIALWDEYARGGEGSTFSLVG